MLIRTLTVGGNPHDELKCRLKFLQDVEVPVLRSGWAEPGQLGTAALRVFSEREVRDINRLLSQMDGPLADVAPSEPVRLNDCVTVRDEVDGTVEEFVVHDEGLVVRAAGFISADTALGKAVLGKRTGDAFAVVTPAGSRPYHVSSIRRSVPAASRIAN